MPVEVTQVGAGLYFVVGPRTNWCLIREDSEVTLVDAAWPKDYERVVESLSQIGSNPADVEAVVLTHAHPDHIGIAERFRAEHGATVLTHRAEVGHATGDYHQRVAIVDLLVRLWRPSVVAFVVTPIARGGMRPTAVSSVEPFDDSRLDVPGHLVPIPTPGHTSGHCSFHLPDHGAVITGDALVNHNLLTNRAGPRLMPRVFSHDWEQAAASLEQLAVLDATLLLPGHGAVLRMAAADAVREARQRLSDGSWWDR